MNSRSISRREFLWGASVAALCGNALPEYSRGQAAGDEAAQSHTLWSMAEANQRLLALTAWFTAQNVDKFLSSTAGINDAINWCRKYGVMKVRLEAFGRGLYANRTTLTAAKGRFLAEGFAVQGGVTTYNFGKNGFGDQRFLQSPCYTVPETQDELQRIFEYAASFFDHIIIDDLYFMDCQCAECVTARGDRSWSKYYCDLMDKLSQERVINAARAVNPNVKIVIKFPQWYDNFHERGYDVPGESKLFDGIWVGTEARNFDYDKSDGYETGYNPIFNLRWLGSFSSITGGWFDSEATTSTTFLEQARHTVLGGGKEIILWCYGEMIKETIGKGTPAANMDALSKELPGLIKLAEIVRDKPIKGIHLLKPGNSDAFEEEWVCSFLGNLGLPLMPAHEIDEQAKSAIFPVQALKDLGFPDALQRMLEKGTPVVITDGLAKRLTSHHAILTNKNLTILEIKGSSKTLLKLTREQLTPIREKLLAPMELKFDAPNKVELYLFGDNHFVVENINDEAVEVTLDLPHVSTLRKALVLPEDTDHTMMSQTGKSVNIRISPRTLVAVEYH
jgi:hypothetical protein